MTFMELAKERYSVRKFSDKPIEKEKLDAILEAGTQHPGRRAGCQHRCHPHDAGSLGTWYRVLLGELFPSDEDGGCLPAGTE